MALDLTQQVVYGHAAIGGNNGTTSQTARLRLETGTTAPVAPTPVTYPDAHYATDTIAFRMSYSIGAGQPQSHIHVCLVEDGVDINGEASHPAVIDDAYLGVMDSGPGGGFVEGTFTHDGRFGALRLVVMIGDNAARAASRSAVDTGPASVQYHHDSDAAANSAVGGAALLPNRTAAESFIGSAHRMTNDAAVTMVDLSPFRYGQQIQVDLDLGGACINPKQIRVALDDDLDGSAAEKVADITPAAGTGLASNLFNVDTQLSLTSAQYRAFAGVNDSLLNASTPAGQLPALYGGSAPLGLTASQRAWTEFGGALPPGPQLISLPFFDAMQDPAGGDLSTHTPRTGGSWAAHPASSASFTMQDPGISASGSEAIYLVADAPNLATDLGLTWVASHDGSTVGELLAMLRSDAADDTCYAAGIAYDGANYIARISVFDQGVETILDSATVSPSGANHLDPFEFEISGDATVELELRFLGQVVCSHTDASPVPATLGQIGVRSDGGWIAQQFAAEYLANLPTLDFTQFSKVMTKALFLPGGSIIGASETGIERSDDGGATWTNKRTFTNAEEARCLFRAANGYLYASFSDTITATPMSPTDLGLFRSIDDGDTWARVITLTGGRESIWGFAEAPNGTLYAAVYTLANDPAQLNDRVYRSTDNGENWTIVFDEGFRHCHQIVCDPNNGDVYLTVGDDFNAEQTYISTTQGASWTTILNGVSIQYVAAIALPSGVRLFGSDEGADSVGFGRMDRTIDNSTLEVVIDVHYANFFEMRRNPTTGHIYATMQSGGSTALWGGLYRSTDDGETWYPVDIEADSPLQKENGYWFMSEFEADEAIATYTNGGINFQIPVVVTDGALPVTPP